MVRLSYAELHCLSNFSFLQGASHPEDLATRAASLGLPALALTDRDGLHGIVRFDTAARHSGLKPIFGSELGLEDGTRLVLLARDLQGYRNLVKLSSLAYTEGFYGKPRMDRELLAKYSEGIIVSSACMAGEVATHLLRSDVDKAKEAAEWYADVFKDRSSGLFRTGCLNQI